MKQHILQFVAVTSGGRGYDIEFPLHPETRSAQSVSDLTTRLLEAISAHAGQGADVSDGDILQALAMTTAIRGRMLDGDPRAIEGLIRALQQSAWEAVQAADAFAASRA